MSQSREPVLRGVSKVVVLVNQSRRPVGVCLAGIREVRRLSVDGRPRLKRNSE